MLADSILGHLGIRTQSSQIMLILMSLSSSIQRMIYIVNRFLQKYVSSKHCNNRGLRNILEIWLKPNHVTMASFVRGSLQKMNITLIKAV